MKPPTIVLRVPATVHSNIVALIANTQSGDLETLLRKSLALYDVAHAHQREGGTLLFRNKDGTEEPLTL